MSRCRRDGRGEQPLGVGPAAHRGEADLHVGRRGTGPRRQESDKPQRISDIGRVAQGRAERHGRGHLRRYPLEVLRIERPKSPTRRLLAVDDVGAPFQRGSHLPGVPDAHQQFQTRSLVAC